MDVYFLALDKMGLTQSHSEKEVDKAYREFAILRDIYRSDRDTMTFDKSHGQIYAITINILNYEFRLKLDDLPINPLEQELIGDAYQILDLRSRAIDFRTIKEYFSKGDSNGMDYLRRFSSPENFNQYSEIEILVSEGTTVAETCELVSQDIHNLIFETKGQGAYITIVDANFQERIVEAKKIGESYLAKIESFKERYNGNDVTFDVIN